jgi:hypothetical protein
MTRFKELKRIEAALEHKDRAALQWALGYCTMRIKIATRKEHVKEWREIESKVKAALASLQQGTTTIFVRLLNEGTDVWRPVNAIQNDSNRFVIVSENPHPEDETREFVQGQKVKCKEAFSQEGDVILVAVALAVDK